MLHSNVFRYAAKTAGSSAPFRAIRAQGSSVSKRAPISASQTTSRGSPCASSATHESLTVRRPVSSSERPSTSHGRPRNSTKSLTLGADSPMRLPPPQCTFQAHRHDRPDRSHADKATYTCPGAKARSRGPVAEAAAPRSKVSISPGTNAGFNWTSDAGQNRSASYFGIDMLLDVLSPNTDEGSREPRVVRNQPQACSFRKSDLVLVASRSFYGETMGPGPEGG